MKKFLTVLMIFFVFSISACGEKSSEKMYIEAARLTDEENNIVELLGLDTEHQIYDFYLDDTVNSIQINIYELIDGKWSNIPGGGTQALTDSEGRIALDFKKISDGLRVAIQSENSNGAVSNYKENNDNSNAGYATSYLTGKKEFVYEEEIPLAIQIVTSKNEINSYIVDYFYQPEEYEKYGYEHVYAITVLFSQKAVNDLTGF